MSENISVKTTVLKLEFFEDGPGVSRVEFTVSDATMKLSIEEIKEAFSKLLV